MQKTVKLRDIKDNPFQCRQEFDEAAINSLVAEIREEGWWNTHLQARKGENGKYELVFGHRRIQALRRLRKGEVRVEIVKLTDAQMALRALEENEQRDGLTDWERADAVKLAVGKWVEEGDTKTAAAERVSKMTGLSKMYVSKLVATAEAVPDKEKRKSMKEKGLSARASAAAVLWMGEKYAATLAEQAQRQDVTHPSVDVVDMVKARVEKLPGDLKAKIKHDLIRGALLTDVSKVEASIRRRKANKAAKEPPEQPDLKLVIERWIGDLKAWNQQLKEVAPYMDYIEEVPSLAKDFRKVLREHIKIAEKLL